MTPDEFSMQVMVEQLCQLHLENDPELSRLFPPLTPVQEAALAASLKQQGCQTPLVVWKEENLLLDGKSRYKICCEYNIPFQVTYLSFESRDEAVAWVIDHYFNATKQVGARQLSRQREAYLQGQRYLLAKQQGKRYDLSTSGKFCHKLSTAAQLATEYGVSEKSIRYNAQFFKAVTQLIDFTQIPRLQDELVEKWQKYKVIHLAKQVAENPEGVREALRGKTTKVSPSSPTQSRDREMPRLAVATHLLLEVGGLVGISCLDKPEFHHREGRVAKVNEKTAVVWLRNLETMVMEQHTFKHTELRPLAFEENPDLKGVRSRVLALTEIGRLHPFHRDILMLLERNTAFCPEELEMLAQLEAQYLGKERLQTLPSLVASSR